MIRRMFPKLLASSLQNLFLLPYPLFTAQAQGTHAHCDTVSGPASFTVNGRNMPRSHFYTSELQSVLHTCRFFIFKSNQPPMMYS